MSSVHSNVFDLFFQTNVPVIGILCNNGLRQRHWDSMSEIIEINITPDSSTTLRKMLKNNLAPCMEEFEIISTGASKVFYKFKLYYAIIFLQDYV